MSRFAAVTLFYISFAIVAMCINLFLQWLTLLLYHGPLNLPVAMMFGTLSGLLVKYVLDKKWIFRHHDNSADTHLRKFTGYALTGVATTLLFWGFELAFNAIGPEWRFPGAVLGLAIGYAAKYRLDTRFVFGASP